MNHLLLDTLAGQATSRRPVWLMRQAGRCLPEYRAIRARHSFLEVMRQPELAAEVTLQPIERFGFDAAIVFADLMTPVEGLGLAFDFAPGPVMEEPLRTAAQIRALPEPVPGEVSPGVSETLRIVRKELRDRAALIGFVGAPLSLAAYLVEGKGAKGFPRLRALAWSDPASFHLLMEKLVSLVLIYAREQKEAGAQVLQIFDSWAGLFPEARWEQLVRPHLLRLCQGMDEVGLPWILFLHNAPHLVDAFAALPGRSALGVDWRVDLAALRRQLGPERVLQGNLDPAALMAGPEAARAAAQELIAKVPARGHVFNLGHGIHPDTPLESIAALLEVVRSESQA